MKLSSPINSQISNLRLRIEILQDRKEIEMDIGYVLPLDSDSRFHYRLSLEKVKQIGKRIEVLEAELVKLLAQWLTSLWKFVDLFPQRAV